MNTPVVRHLADSDRWRLRPHYKALNPEDRRLRFGVTLNDDALDRYVDLINFDTDAVLGVVDASDNLVAVVHVAPVGEGAELGLSVHDGQRGQGLGGALFEQAAAWARNRYLQRIFMHCLRENRAILHLARSHGMTVSMEGGESSAVMLLAAPTFDTLVNEQVTHWPAAAADLRQMESRWFDCVLAGPQAVAAAFTAALRAGKPLAG